MISHLRTRDGTFMGRDRVFEKLINESKMQGD